MVRVFQIGKVQWRALIGVIAFVCTACFAPLPTYTTGTAGTAPDVDFLHAPDFSLTALDGRPVSLSDWRGQVVLLNFWTTECVPCRAEMPEIQAAYQAYQDRNFVVLSINVKEDEQAVAQFAEAFHLTMPVLLDHDGSTTRHYRVRGLPTSFLIDPEGVIREVRVGEINRAYIESQLVALGVLAVSHLTTPTPATPTPEPATPIGSVAFQRLDLDSFLPPGRGRDLLLMNCGSCHSFVCAVRGQRAVGHWEHLKQFHTGRLPGLSEEDYNTLFAYLAENLNDTKPEPKLPPLLAARGCGAFNH